MSIESFVKEVSIEPIHKVFMQMIERRSGLKNSMLGLISLLTSDQALRGHVCLRLSDIAELEYQEQKNPASTIPLPEQDWDVLDSQIAMSKMVAIHADTAEPGCLYDAPLVYDQRNRAMYLGRYWFYESKLALLIQGRLAAESLAINDEQLKKDIQRFYPDVKASQHDQMIAAGHAMDRPFTIIAGGPGTGKTTTLSAVLVMRLNQYQTLSQSVPNIMLMAPTGKAAQRLNESLSQAMDRLPLTNDERDKLQNIKAGTIHRMLGWTPKPPEKGGPFKHHHANPLLADIVVVDEASMVDIGLMFRLVDAIRNDAQLILVGDPNQLASVEAGSVLGDLCRHSSMQVTDYLDAQRVQLLSTRTGVPLEVSDQHIHDPLRAAACFLRYSHRFNEQSPVGQLAKAIRFGQVGHALTILHSDQDQIQWQTSEGNTQILESAVKQYQKIIKQIHNYPHGRKVDLEALADYRVLCAHHEGERGDTEINRRIHHRLHSETDTSLQDYPVGTPVMVTSNNYKLNLYNGDLGMVVMDQRTGEAHVAFEDHEAEDGLRRVPLVLLQDAVLCYAMSIHRSQGSEFHQVALVLPDSESPILTRELLYTGLTRMCDRNQQPGRVDLYASQMVLHATIIAQIRRSSGLRESF